MAMAMNGSDAKARCAVFLFPQESPGAGRGAPGYCARSAGGEVIAAGSSGGAGRKTQGAATGCAGRRHSQQGAYQEVAGTGKDGILDQSCTI